MTKLGTEAIGFRTGSMPLGHCYKFTEVLVVVLNLQVQLVAYMRVCQSWKLAVTFHRARESRVKSGYKSVSKLNDFFSE